MPFQDRRLRLDDDLAIADSDYLRGDAIWHSAPGWRTIGAAAWWEGNTSTRGTA